MRPDDDESVPAGMAVRPDVGRGQRLLRVEPGQGAHERRPAAVQERAAGRLGPAQSEHDDLEVVVVGRVDDDERAAGDARGGSRRRGSAPPSADVVEADAVDVARRAIAPPLFSATKSRRFEAV